MEALAGNYLSYWGNYLSYWGNYPSYWGRWKPRGASGWKQLNPNQIERERERREEGKEGKKEEFKACSQYYGVAERVLIEKFKVNSTIQTKTPTILREQIEAHIDIMTVFLGVYVLSGVHWPTECGPSRARKCFQASYDICNDSSNIAGESHMQEPRTQPGLLKPHLLQRNIVEINTGLNRQPLVCTAVLHQLVRT